MYSFVSREKIGNVDDERRDGEDTDIVWMVNAFMRRGCQLFFLRDCCWICVDKWEQRKEKPRFEAYFLHVPAYKSSNRTMGDFSYLSWRTSAKFTYTICRPRLSQQYSWLDNKLDLYADERPTVDHMKLYPSVNFEGWRGWSDAISGTHEVSKGGRSLNFAKHDRSIVPSLASRCFQG